MKEVWKIVDDPLVQERYFISSFGRLLDLLSGKYLNFSDNGAGYKVYGLQRKDKDNVAIRYVHRLVAKAFIPNIYNCPQVGHKDHDSSNNVVCNLQWTTQKENTRDGIDAGRINARKRPNTKRLTKQDICAIATMEDMGYGVNEIAIQLGFARTTISSVFNGRSNWELFSFAREEIALSKKLG